jgi:hypothetical protein
MRSAVPRRKARRAGGAETRPIRVEQAQNKKHGQWPIRKRKKNGQGCVRGGHQCAEHEPQGGAETQRKRAREEGRHDRREDEGDAKRRVGDDVRARHVDRRDARRPVDVEVDARRGNGRDREQDRQALPSAHMGCAGGRAVDGNVKIDSGGVGLVLDIDPARLVTREIRKEHDGATAQRIVRAAIDEAPAQAARGEPRIAGAREERAGGGDQADGQGDQPDGAAPGDHDGSSARSVRGEGDGTAARRLKRRTTSNAVTVKSTHAAGSRKNLKRMFSPPSKTIETAKT